MPDAVPAAARQRKLTLIDRLHDVEDDHNAAIRTLRAGVSIAALEQDLCRWRALGSAIVELARLVRGQCAASDFCDARPGTAILAARLVEAIDDQLDQPAWSVVDAQVRLQATRVDE
jgi:fructose-1,6-bisphosphatase/inositol monophosphatase family enzyme